MPDVTLDDLKNAADQLDQLRQDAQEKGQAEASAKEMLDTATADHADAVAATAAARVEVGKQVATYIQMIHDFAGDGQGTPPAQPGRNAPANARRPR